MLRIPGHCDVAALSMFMFSHRFNHQLYQALFSLFRFSHAHSKKAFQSDQTRISYFRELNFFT